MKTKKMLVGLGTAAALGAAVVPMASYAATDSEAVTVNLEVGSTISMTVDSNSVSDSLSGVDSSSDQTTVATVTTNSTSGYALSAATSSNDGSLVGTAGSIAYVGSDFGTETEGWALSIPGANDTVVYKDIVGNTISGLGGSSTPVDNDTSTITYNFKIDGDTVSGNYATTLTYTATTN